MTPFLQFRLWLREAPRTERQVTAVVAVVLLVVLAAAFRPLTRAAGSHGGDSVGYAGTAGAPGALGGTSAPQAVGAGPAGVAAGGLTSSGTVGAVPGPAGVGVATGPSGSGGSAPGTSGQAGTAPGSTGGGHPAPGQRPALTATDRGVTADSVTLGFMLGTLGGINQAGVAADLRSDMSQVVDAIVDDANKHGGLGGRKVIAAKTTVDVTNSDSQRQGCLTLTQTDHVFAVLDPATLSFAAGRSCVTVENKTPLLTLIYPGGANEFTADAPYLMALSQNDTRRVQNWVLAAKQNGFFDPAKGFKKLGILSDSCEPTVVDGADGLKNALRQAGVSAWSEFRLDCDVSSQQREAPSAVLQFRQDGVSHVFLATNTIADKTFTQTAQGQAYALKYFLSDFWGLVNDVNTKLLEQSQVDGSLGVSAFNHGPALSFPAVKRCNDILVAHGLAAIQSFSHDFEAIIACDHLDMMVKAAGIVGPDLTRPRVAAAIQTSGEFDGGFVHYDQFNQLGKTSGGDQVQVLRWSQGCSCWTPTGGYRAGR